jgi:hypothetical protein
MWDASHWRFERLDFTGWTRDNGAHFLIGVGTEDNTNTGCFFDQCRFYGFEGSGFAAYNASNLTLTDCDSYENDDAGDGNADGFSISSAGAGCTLTRCRAYDNGDDGFDLWDTVNPVTLDTCWSFRNGWEPGTSTPSGDGNGFKLGRDTVGTGEHVVTNCLAAGNRQNGFDFNDSTAAQTWTNCTSLNNGLYSFSAGNGQGVTLDQCVAFGGTLDIGTGNTATYCSWTNPPGVTVSEASFETVSIATLDDARGSDGALPVTEAGVAAAGGNLAGVAPDNATPGWSPPAATLGDWRPCVVAGDDWLAFCPDGTCNEPVGTTDPYYLRYRIDPTGEWSPPSDGKTFTVTAATVTAASGEFAFELQRGAITTIDLRQLFVADFPIEITIDDADMPEPFAIDADGLAQVTVAADATLGERTVTVTADFVGATPPPPVALEPQFVGESYASSSTVDLPVDMLAGDVVFIAARGPDTMPVPAGWTVIFTATETLAGTDVRLVYAWKTAETAIMGSGEWTGAARLLAGVYRNLDPTAPIGTPVNGTTSAAGVVTYPAVGSLGDGAHVVAMQYTQANVEPPQHPGMVVRRTGPGTSFNRLRLMDTDGAVTELAETTGTAGGSTSAFRVTLFTLNPKEV